MIPALKMKQLMDREGLSRAELARRMNLSIERITQIMNLLNLSPEVIEMIKGIVDRLKKPVITERRLRGGGEGGRSSGKKRNIRRFSN